MVALLATLITMNPGIPVCQLTVPTRDPNAAQRLRAHFKDMLRTVGDAVPSHRFGAGVLPLY
jgi:hypothetical protein